MTYFLTSIIVRESRLCDIDHIIQSIQFKFIPSSMAHTVRRR